MNVSTDLQDLMIWANRDRGVSAAKQRTAPLQAQVDQPRKATQQVLHARRDVSLLAPYQQVEMIRHEAISVDFKVGSVGGDGKCIKEDFAIGIVLKYVPMVGASIHDVMPSAGKINTRMARHWSKVPEQAVFNTNPGCHTVSDPEGRTPWRAT